MERILNSVIGAAGIGATQIVNTIPTPDQWTEIAKLVVQVVIAIATLWGIFKPKTNKERFVNKFKK